MEDTQYMSDEELIDEDEFDIMQTFGKQKESNLFPLPLIKFSHLDQPKEPEYQRRKFLPQKIKKTEEYKPVNTNYIGPMRPPSVDSDEDQEDSDDDTSRSGSMSDSIEKQIEPDWAGLGIPVTHEAVLPGHRKNVTDLTLDKTCTRMVSGGEDYNILFWDFPNMTQNYRHFRTLQPIEGQPIQTCSFDNKGTKIFVCGRSPKPKLLTRDGKEIIEFVRGDMYISDVAFSRGHISTVTSGYWHPTDENILITSSMDSTIRIWDVNSGPFGIEAQLANLKCIRCKNSKGLKTGVFRCKVSPDATLIAAACEDGSFQMFSAKNQYSRPVHEYRRNQGAEITDMQFFKDSHRFVSRATDNTMRLFDLRNFKAPVYTWYDLLNNSSHTSMAISPDERYIATGTSNTKSDLGQLAIFSTSPGDEYKEIGRIQVAEGKVNAVIWPEQLNQIIMAAGNDIKIFYSPNLSSRGAMLGAKRKVREKHIEEMEYKRPVYTPHALPLYNENHKYKRKNYEQKREDTKLSHKPDIPLTGVGKGGKISGPNTLTQNIMATINRVDQTNMIDPREAAAKFRKEAEENPEYIDQAYKDTQPIKILDWTSREPEEQQLMSMYSKCAKCGLKLCQCVAKRN
jgi:WD40 repeat protein